MKQAIVVRTDLEMGKGKIAGQAAHASVGAYIFAETFDPRGTDKWNREGAKKIVLKVSGEKELFTIFQKAKDEDLPCILIHDAGKTQLEPGTATAVGIGPAEDNKIDKIISALKLL
jgi:PTH2 family peptidyl-tRNA hydrolase